MKRRLLFLAAICWLAVGGGVFAQAPERPHPTAAEADAALERALRLNQVRTISPKRADGWEEEGLILPGVWHHFRIDVERGQSELFAETWDDGWGDVDLYIREDDEPDLDHYDFRSRRHDRDGDSNEDIVINGFTDPQLHEDDWYVSVFGYAHTYYFLEVTVWEEPVSVSGWTEPYAAVRIGDLATVTADFSGYYQYGGIPYDWSGVVTPSKPGLTFNPPSRQYTQYRRPTQDQNFAAVAPISPRLTGWTLAGTSLVIESAGGQLVDTVVARADGFWMKEGLAHGWSGSVTPSKPDYRFEPSVRNYTNLTSSMDNQNFDGISSLLRITGWTMPGAQLTLTDTGGAILSVVTAAADGSYVFNSVPYGWSGSITPSFAGTTFDPPSRSYAALGANLDHQLFNHHSNTVSITGWTAANATLVIRNTDGGTLASMVSGVDGFYRFDQAPRGWTGSITPVLTDYRFEPPTRYYYLLNEGLSDQNFTATYDSPLCESTYGGFADQQYRDFLEREPDPEGHQYYVQNLCSGALTTAQTVRNFIASPEFTQSNGFIARCYFAIFNNNFTTPYTDPGYRVPEYSGIQFWNERMQSVIQGGGSLTDAKSAVIGGFTGSAEWQARVGNLDDEQFVNFLYENILSRATDPGGRVFHMASLQSGTVTRDRLVLNFIESPEAMEKFSNHTYVVMAYLGLLRREAEKAGFDYHMGTLIGEATDPVTFLNAFIYSPEYVNRLDGMGITVP